MARAHVDDTPPGDLDLDNGGTAIATANSFIVASNRTIYAIWAWIPATNTGTYTFELYRITGDDDPGPAAGTLLTSEVRTAAQVTAGQWNRIELTSPQAVTTANAYRVSRHASSGRFVRTAGALSSGPIINAGIEIVQSGTNPNALYPGVLRNGVFREGAVGYPSSVFGQPDYYVDVDDAPNAPPEVTGALAATTTRPTSILTADETFVGALAATTVRPTSTLTAVENVPGAIAATTTRPVSALAGAVAIPATGVLSAVTAAPTAALAGYVPVTERPSGWGPLLDMFRNARAGAGQRVPMVACPRCGEPLQLARGVRHCPFDGFRAAG